MSQWMTHPGTGERVEVPTEQVRSRMLAGWRTTPGSRFRAWERRLNAGTGEEELVEGEVDGARLMEYMADGRVVMPGDESEAQGLSQAARAQARARSIDQAAGERGFFEEFGRGFADATTMGNIGVTDRFVAEREGRLEDYETVRARTEEVNPGALVGEVASYMTPVLGWRAAVVGGASTVGLAAGRGAQAAVRGTLGRLGVRSGTAEAAGRVVGMGVGEGAVGGMAAELADMRSRGETDDFAERMLGMGVMGGLLGGALEGGMMGAGRLFRGATRGTSASSIERSITSRSIEERGRLAALRGRGEAVLGGVDMDAQRVWRRRRSDGSLDDGTALRDDRVLQSAQAFEANPDQFYDAFAAGLQQEVRHWQQVLNDVYTGSGARRIRDAVSSADGAALQGAISSVRDAARRVSVDIGQAPGMASSTAGNALRDAAETLKGDGLTAARLLDVRRDIGRIAVKADDVAVATWRGNLMEQIDEAMSSPGLGDFGGLYAARQRFVDQAEQNLVRFRTTFGGEGSEVVNKQKIRAIAREFADEGAGSGPQQAARDILSGNAQQMDQLRALGLADDAMVRRVGTAFDGVDAQRLSDAMEAGLAFQRAERMQNRASGLGANLGVSAMGGAGIGFALGGLPGAAIGLGVAALTKPASFAAAWSRVKQFIRGQDTRVRAATQAVDDRISGKKVKLGFGSLQRPPVGSLAAVWLNGKEEDKIRRYEELAQRVEDLSLDPNAFLAELQASLADAEPLGSDVVQALGEKSTGALHTLASLLPPSRRQRGRGPGAAAQLPQIRYRPSATEMDRFLEAAAVIEDPVFGVELLGAGVLSNHGARALESGHPRAFQAVVGGVMASYFQRLQRGESVDYQTMAQISTLTGIPMDSTLNPSFIMSMQQQYAQTSEQERAVRSPDTVQREVSQLYASQHETINTRLSR